MGIQLHQGFAPFDVSFSVAARAFEGFGIDGVMGHSFPNAVPSGTRVPQWALRDVTVSCYCTYLFSDTY